jgi:hypothetical protein
VKARGASLRATEQSIDTSTAAGKCLLVLGVFAEFETNLRRERQPLGRPPSRGHSRSVEPRSIERSRTRLPASMLHLHAPREGKISIWDAKFLVRPRAGLPTLGSGQRHMSLGKWA